jgi:hypothetical protein
MFVQIQAFEDCSKKFVKINMANILEYCLIELPITNRYLRWQGILRSVTPVTEADLFVLPKITTNAQQRTVS